MFGSKYVIHLLITTAAVPLMCWISVLTIIIIISTLACQVVLVCNGRGVHEMLSGVHV